MKLFSEALIIEDEVLEWYSLSPAERFEESLKLWEVFVLFGGQYDPEPDTQSHFHIFETKKAELEAWRRRMDKK